MRAALLGLLALAGCAGGLLLQDHPLAGRVWDVRTGAFVTAEEMLAQAARSQHVILGETHDNPEHHRLQRVALETIARDGKRRALAMEQFDSEHQSAIDAARARAADAEALADAGRFDRKGWNWALYKPLVEFAVERGWPLVAANLSRGEARLIIAEPSRSGLPPAAAAMREALERDLIEGHCGERPEARRLAGMVEAQRARDARMAGALVSQAATATVLVTGQGHARKDAGVPRYLKDDAPISIGLVEVEDAQREPRDYLTGFATQASFDYLWFTPRFARKDPCGAMKPAAAR
ncbi:MAG: hypothetical protein EPO27_17930 [Betaproteobacteria bacterium]|nr:MAG: hypothetical protein EPO27_17930 [Betaproteobacteria bacterium]